MGERQLQDGWRVEVWDHHGFCCTGTVYQWERLRRYGWVEVAPDAGGPICPFELDRVHELNVLSHGE